MKLSLAKILLELRKTLENKKGKMVSIPVPENIALKLHSHFMDVKGDNVAPEDMHMTIGLVRDENMGKTIAGTLNKALSGFGDFPLSIDKFDFFPPNDHNDQQHVLIARPQANQIPELHKTVFDAFKRSGLNIDNGKFEFSPHITIKYCKEKPDIHKELKDPVDFIVDKIEFVDQGKKQEIYLKNRE